MSTQPSFRRLMSMKKKSKFDALIWDIDDTLINTAEMARSAQREALSLLLGDYSMVERGLDMWDRLLWFFKPSQIESVLASICSEFGFAFNKPEIKKGLDTFWDAFFSKVILHSDVEQTLEQLAKIQVQLGIVSNGDKKLQMWKLEKSGLIKFFQSEAIIIIDPSSEFAKPNPYGLVTCCNALETNVKKSCYIGDRITDVIAANLAGATSILLQSKALEAKEPDNHNCLQVELPTFEMRSVKELLSII